MKRYSKKANIYPPRAIISNISNQLENENQWLTAAGLRQQQTTHTKQRAATTTNSRDPDDEPVSQHKHQIKHE